MRGGVGGASGLRRARQWVPLAPALVFMAVFFVQPLARMVMLSFDAADGALGHYGRVLDSPVYLRVLGMTFRTALGVTNLIEVQVVELLNWGFGSAPALVLLLATVIIMVLFDRFLGLDRLTV